MANYQEDESDTYVSKCVKFSLCFFNFLFWICGLFLIGFGIWITVEEESLTQGRQIDVSWSSRLLDVSIGIITLGIIIFLIPLIGFLGALREQLILLKIFCGLVIFIVMIEVLLIILAFVFWERIVESIKNFTLDKIIVQYHDDLNYKFIIDTIQELLNCCGAVGYLDWGRNDYYNCSSTNPSLFRCAVPNTCCLESVRTRDGVEDHMCGFGVQDSQIAASPQHNSVSVDRIHTKGCIIAFKELLKNNVTTLAMIISSILLCQIISTAMAEYMISRIKSFCKDYRAGTLKRNRSRRRLPRSPQEEQYRRQLQQQYFNRS